MQNKIKVIDISIVSTYMGRYLTAVVAVLVVAITISALFSSGGWETTGDLVVAVPMRESDEETLRHFEPLRTLIEQRVGRSVRLEVRGQYWPEACHLYVMSIHEFHRVRDERQLTAIYSVEPAGGLAGAVIISGGDSKETPAGVSGADVLHMAPHSINGCWIQLRALEERGVVFAPSLEDLEYAPPPGRAERVVYSVALGQYRIGTVPRMAVDKMLSDRRIVPGEVTVVATFPSLPETVLCVRRDALPPALGEDENGTLTRGESLHLSRIDHSEMERIEELFEYVSSRR